MSSLWYIFCFLVIKQWTRSVSYPYTFSFIFVVISQLWPVMVHCSWILFRGFCMVSSYYIVSYVEDVFIFAMLCECFHYVTWTCLASSYRCDLCLGCWRLAFLEIFSLIQCFHILVHHNINFIFFIFCCHFQVGSYLIS